nr:MAG TPA: hypothetical protein [Caudoviricetes sp.]
MQPRNILLTSPICLKEPRRLPGKNNNNRLSNEDSR